MPDFMRTALLASLVLGLAAGSPAQPTADSRISTPSYCPVLYSAPAGPCRPTTDGFLQVPANQNKDEFRAGIHIFEDAFKALEVLQHDYFNLEVGTWTEAIDWTAAVTQTVTTGMLSTLSRFIKDVASHQEFGWTAKENLVSTYYSHVVNSYFGQDILSLRGQAYDDMLWVVLGWLEAIKFVKLHTKLHYATDMTDPSVNGVEGQGLWRALRSLPWYGHHWVNSFAHRARVFWNLSSRGWDTKLCHGGMIWNPRLGPYKNAITNELWIAASTAMYLHFPGDNFTSPWSIDQPFPRKDPAHLEAAIQGYQWLMNVNMTNQKGLFVDGYHIDSRKPGNVECDLRDEMIYTYNQGVILTAQHGLWTVTGSPSYLEDGHRLIQSVIRATGWHLERNAPSDDLTKTPNSGLALWHGLGRGGVMEEQCDASGTCSQDAQTFKGIFFHHFTNFCNELDPIRTDDGQQVDEDAFHKVRKAHTNACNAYLGWTRYNALAALSTRDDDGHFGMWWGASLTHGAQPSHDTDGIDHGATNTTDYRNEGTPINSRWGTGKQWLPGTSGTEGRQATQMLHEVVEQDAMSRPRPKPRSRSSEGDGKDPNTRGRGRTVETQLGGLSVVRAFWELSQDR